LFGWGSGLQGEDASQPEGNDPMTLSVNSPVAPTIGAAERVRLIGTSSVALLHAARPRQWIKNIAVLIVPGLSILTIGRSQIFAALGAVLAFSLAASSVYLVNDTLDRHKDANHPTKRFRPIASGIVSPASALGASLLFAFASLLLGMAIAPVLGGVVAVYLVITAAYSLKLKHIAVVDVGVLSLGFILRVVAGAVAVGRTAPPLLMVSVFWAAVFVALGKRRSESMLLGRGAAAHRPTLGVYTIPFIDASLLDSQRVSVLAFGGWILLALHSVFGLTLATVAGAALLVAFGAYRKILQSGGGGDPSRELMTSPLVVASLSVCGLAALATGLHR
jgi:decaprenyl-phosphate phosphoribosyltransferase